MFHTHLHSPYAKVVCLTKVQSRYNSRATSQTTYSLTIPENQFRWSRLMAHRWLTKKCSEAIESTSKPHFFFPINKIWLRSTLSRISLPTTKECSTSKTKQTVLNTCTQTVSLTTHTSGSHALTNLISRHPTSFSAWSQLIGLSSAPRHPKRYSN